MPKLTIQPALLSLLKSSKYQRFTIPQLRDGYLGLKECPHSSAKAAQQYIYKNVLRLEGAGLVTRTNTRNGKNIQFKLDSSFFTEPQKESPLIESEKLGANEEDIGAVNKMLRDKLNRYKLELLSAIGETEEYDALCREVPQIKNDIQELYNQVRDKSSKLLGKVKALEFLLARYQLA